MRTIKFRAWHKKDKRMYLVTGFAWHLENLVLVSVLKDRVVNQNPEDLEIMQFTGLTDKNGKEIYEGDIVSVNYVSGERQPEEVYWCSEGAGWFLQRPEYSGWGNKMQQNYVLTYEVVGNICENPELLK